MFYCSQLVGFHFSPGIFIFRRTRSSAYMSTRVLMAFLQLFGYSNSWTNSVIYCFLSRKFPEMPVSSDHLLSGLGRAERRSSAQIVPVENLLERIADGNHGSEKSRIHKRWEQPAGTERSGTPETQEHGNAGNYNCGVNICMGRLNDYGVGTEDWDLICVRANMDCELWGLYMLQTCCNIYAANIYLYILYTYINYLLLCVRLSMLIHGNR